MSDPEKAYLEAVMEDFFRKSQSQEFYHYLNNPSPDSIKSLALNLLKYERQEKQLGEDRGILTNFLDFRSDEEAYVPRTFQKFVTDIKDYKKFKRISQFVNRYKEDPTRSTSMINIDFIAWLIDFTPRPIHNYRREFYPDSYNKTSGRLTPIGLGNVAKTPKAIAGLEIKKEELEDLLANFRLPDFEKKLGALAQQQLQLMLEEWKEKELVPLFERLIEERLLKLDKKIQRSRGLYRRLGFLGLLFIPREDRLLFEDDLLGALEDYQIDISGDGIEDSILESISELGNVN